MMMMMMRMMTMMMIGIVCILNCPTAPSQEREVVQWLGLELKHIGDDDDDDDESRAVG